MLVPPSANLEDNRNGTHFCPISRLVPSPFCVSRRHNLGTMRHRDALELPLERDHFLLSISRSPRVRLFKRLNAPYLM
jgi:hypothetical protein